MDLVQWMQPGMSWFGANSGWIGVLVTGLVPIALYRAGKKVEESSASEQNAIRALQSSQETIAKAARRDEMIRLLPTVRPGLHLDLLKRDMAMFDGTVDEVPLAQALHSNISYPLPASGERYFVPAVVEQIISTLGDRFAAISSHHPYPGLSDFIVDCQTSARLEDGQRSSYASDFASFLAQDNSNGTRLTHEWVRELLTRGAWDLAAPLLYRLESISSQAGGAKFNILCGVMLAIIDDDQRRLDGPRQRPPVDRNGLYSSVLGALAHVLHRNQFSSYGLWNQTGSTDAWSAGAAWLIRVVGIVSQSDGHLEMRCVENLGHMLSSIQAEGKIRWGIDDQAVEAGFVSIRSRCPGLWSIHGTRLEALSGVQIQDLHA